LLGASIGFAAEGWQGRRARAYAEANPAATSLEDRNQQSPKTAATTELSR
jgi:hypothetical protein